MGRLVSFELDDDQVTVVKHAVASRADLEEQRGQVEAVRRLIEPQDDDDEPVSKTDNKKTEMLDEFTKQMAELGVRNRLMREERERQTKERTTMDTTTKNAVLTEIAKHRDGLIIFAKQSLASNDPPMFTEAEATEAVTEHFKSLAPGYPDRAFAKGIATTAEGPMLFNWIQSCRDFALIKAAGWDPHNSVHLPDSSPGRPERVPHKFDPAAAFKYQKRPAADDGVESGGLSVRAEGGPDAFDVNHPEVQQVLGVRPWLSVEEAVRVAEERRAAVQRMNARGGAYGRSGTLGRVSPGHSPSDSSPGRLGHSAPGRSSPGRP
jgi:hypothetical protein